MQRTVLRTSPDQGFKGMNMLGWLILSGYITYEVLSMDQMETNLVSLFFLAGPAQPAFIAIVMGYDKNTAKY